MKIKFLFLCLSCMFLFFLNINCSSSDSVMREDITKDINNNIELPTTTTPVVVNVPKLFVSASGFTFPDVEEGAIVTHVWEIKNIGTGDLIINDVELSCGCTSAIIDNKVIAPNSFTELKAVFDTKGKPGMSSLFIMVHSNDPSAPARQFTMMGKVVPKKATDN